MWHTKQGTIKATKNSLTTDKPVYSNQYAVEKSITYDLYRKRTLPITIIKRKIFRDYLGTNRPFSGKLPIEKMSQI